MPCGCIEVRRGLEEFVFSIHRDLFGFGYQRGHGGLVERLECLDSRERLIEKQHTEVTFAAAGFALVVSMIAGALGLLWFNRLP